MQIVESIDCLLDGTLTIFMIITRKSRRDPLKIVFWITVALIALSVAYPFVSNAIKRSRIKPLKQETHESVAELEQYVYDNVGESIYFGEPEISDRQLEATLALIVEDEECFFMFESARCSINTFLTLYPDYYLNNGYRITLKYYRRDVTPDGQAGIYYLGGTSNYFTFSGDSNVGLEKGVISYDSLCVIRCSDHYRLDELNQSENVKVVIWFYVINSEEIIRLVSSINGLEYVYIAECDDIDTLIYEIHIHNPNVELLWEHI